MKPVIFLPLLSCAFLTSCVSFNRSAPPVSTQRARSLDQFAGTFENLSTPSGGLLSDVLYLHYGSSDEYPTRVELRRTVTGFEAVAFHGSRVGHRRTLTAGSSFTFSGGHIDFGSESGRYDNQFFLTNIKSSSTTHQFASLSSSGDLVFSYSSTTTGTNWGIPTFDSSSHHYVFRRIR